MTPPPAQLPPAMERPTFQSLLQGLPVLGRAGDWQARVSCVVTDSRRIIPGALFFALPGRRADGHAFLDDAIARGKIVIGECLNMAFQNCANDFSFLRRGEGNT